MLRARRRVLCARFVHPMTRKLGRKQSLKKGGQEKYLQYRNYAATWMKYGIKLHWVPAELHKEGCTKSRRLDITNRFCQLFFYAINQQNPQAIKTNLHLSFAAAIIFCCYP